MAYKTSSVKRLLIIRHAKSSWDYPELSDFDRPLNKRGKRDLPEMANRLYKTGIQIDQFLSSPANRTITTAKGHATAYGVSESEIQQKRQLFHASSFAIKQVISETSDSINSLAVFGHNPGLTDLIEELSDFELWNLPTCAICVIDFEIDSWRKITLIKGKKVYYDYPKSKKY